MIIELYELNLGCLSAFGAYCLSYLNWWNVLEENKEKNDLV